MAKETIIAREGRVQGLRFGNSLRWRSRGRMSDGEFRNITRILEKKNADRQDAPRYLEREAMSDRQLRNFYNTAISATSNYDLNKMTRENSRKWANLAIEEMRYRKNNK